MPQSSTAQSTLFVVARTDIRGLLRDKDDEESLIPVVNVSEAPQLMSDGIISEAAFRESLSRGWRTLHNDEKVRKRRWRGLEKQYYLFNSCALCGRIEEHVKTVTIKEYDEDGTLIREYKKDKYYLVAIF